MTRVAALAVWRCWRGTWPTSSDLRARPVLVICWLACRGRRQHLRQAHRSGYGAMSEARPLLTTFRQSADPTVAQCLDHLIEHGTDRDLNRINALAFAASHGLD